MPKWLQALVAITCLMVLGAVGMAAEARYVPHLAPDAPYAPAHATVSELVAEPIALHVTTAAAVREKGRLGICEYPGPFGPCWCLGGVVNGIPLSECRSAADYMNSVQSFGQPRYGLVVPIPDEPTAYDVTIDTY